jgi:mannosyltransferase OCH1-like enzyme
LRECKTPSAIERTVWLTNYTDRVTLPVYLNYLFNRLLASGYEFRFMDDADIQSFIKEECSAENYQAYLCLNDGAARADFWRTLVLCKYGGVYMDIDSHLVWPLARILQPNDDELYVQTKEKSFSNYFMASKANHPHMEKIIATIRRNIQNQLKTNVWGLTGPGPLIEALSGTIVNHRPASFTCIQGSLTNEYFQYLDKPNGKWTHTKEEDIFNRAQIKDDAA